MNPDTLVVSSLSSTLTLLCSKAIVLTQEKKQQGRLIAIEYQHIPVKELDYQMETFNYDWDRMSFFTVYEWPSMVLADFMDKEIKTLPEFDIAVRALADEYKIPDIGPKVGLDMLLNLVVQENINDRITKDNLPRHIEAFINDYETYRNQSALTWNIHLWLDNISLESDEIEIASEVFLRKPTKEQLADIRPRQIYISEWEKITGRGLSTGAIFSFPVKTDERPGNRVYPEIISTEIENWLNVLRLFKPTNVAVTYQTISPVSIVEHGMSEKVDRLSDQTWKGKIQYHDTSNFKLYLRQNEELLLKDFVRRVKPSFKDFSLSSYLNGSLYDLAFHRYNDSLLKSEVNVYRILSAITSIETLLSRGETEISFKIRQRVAKLMSFFDFNALQVAELMKKAYSLRSKLVHGAKPEEKKEDLLEFARENTHEILNFNRICLLISLQLKNITGKEELILRIDNSFIDETTNKELKEAIRKNVVLPIPYPFRKIEPVSKEKEMLA